MISTNSILLKKLKNFIIGNESTPQVPDTSGNLRQEINKTLSSGRQSAGEPLVDQTEPATRVDAEHSTSSSGQLPGLDHPPSHHQLQILKHFKVKNRSEITRSQASVLIKNIFSDPVNIEQWKKRPATSKVKQGILFMGGQLYSSMTQTEAQSMLRHYGKEHAQRLLEWKHIEMLFLRVNSRDNLELYNARKMTWKCFFQVYDDLKDSGVLFGSINADRIHQHAKMIAFTKKPFSCQIKTFAA